MYLFLHVFSNPYFKQEPTVKREELIGDDDDVDT
jgi:hypothetical protein